MTDPHRAAACEPRSGMPPPAFPEPVPLTFPSADPAPAAPAPVIGGPSADPAVSGSPVARARRRGGRVTWPNPYPAAGHQPRERSAARRLAAGSGTACPALRRAPASPTRRRPPAAGLRPVRLRLRRPCSGAPTAWRSARWSRRWSGDVMSASTACPSPDPRPGRRDPRARRPAQDPRERQQGDGMALAGIIIGWITTALAVAHRRRRVVALIVFTPIWAARPGSYRAAEAGPSDRLRGRIAHP